MDSHYRFACSCRSCDPCRTVEIALHQLMLGRMEKNSPLLPWVFQRPFQFLSSANETEASLSVRMLKGFGGGNCQFWQQQDRLLFAFLSDVNVGHSWGGRCGNRDVLRNNPGRKVQQRFRSLFWKMI